MKTERIIVSLTTWAPRIKNIPTVLDSIFNQTLLPDLVVINFSEGEIIPIDIQKYLDEHHVECNFVPDTKVYKKLIPTLKKYPNDCVISIDDDWIYPAGMIEDFMDIHKRYPNNPISGNKEMHFNLQCHCGCASLTKASFFGNHLYDIDAELISNCPSDDIVYTYISSISNKPYLRTKKTYYETMDSINPAEAYSTTNKNGIVNSFLYLKNRFGPPITQIQQYIEDPLIRDIIGDLLKCTIESAKQEQTNIIRSTTAFRIGEFILKPLYIFRKLLQNYSFKQND